MLLTTPLLSVLSLLLVAPFIVALEEAGVHSLPLRRHASLAGRAALQTSDGSVDFAALERALVHLEARYGPKDDAAVVARRERAGAPERRWLTQAPSATGPADAWDGAIKDAAKGLEALFQGLLGWDAPSTSDEDQEFTGNTRLASSGKSAKSASSLKLGNNRAASGAKVSASAPLRDVLSNGRELEFLAEIKIGTPAKSFWLDPDSGSSDLWIKSSSCQTSNCGSKSRARYSQAQSSTYKDTPNGKKFDLTYGIGSVSGRLVRDKVTFGDVQIANQTIGSATKLSDDWRTDKADGVIGLGFRAISSAHQKPFIQNAAEQNNLAAPVVSFAFGRHLSGTEGRSEMRVGGTNPALYKGKIAWYPVTKAGYWEFEFSSFGAGKTKTLKNVDGIVDTGTSLIAMPNEMAREFWGGVPGSKLNEDAGYYSFNCNTDIKATLTLPDGRTIVIDAKDMNLGTDGANKNRCVGAVLPSRTPGQVIFGLSLLKNTYTVLNFGKQPRIGFGTPSF